MSGAPSATRSPDFTKIFVITPSTRGLIVVEFRDFSVAANSEVSSTLLGWATCISTCIGGGPPCGCEAFPLLHPVLINTPMASSAMFRIEVRGRVFTNQTAVKFGFLDEKANEKSQPSSAV